MPYWAEGAYYAFNMAEIERIEAASEELHRLFVAAGEELIQRPDLLDFIGIPTWCHDAVISTWREGHPSLNYGRFDLALAADGIPKLLEYNCDTPTSLLEASVVQWNWKEDLFPHLDQFNSLHERMVARWRGMGTQLAGSTCWFTHTADDAHEDTVTTAYMQELAQDAGLHTETILIDRIGIDAKGRIVDTENNLITAIFKLYPWEWIVAEPYGCDIVRNLASTHWIEPICKMMWSNKAILWLLWEMFPEHENLLPAALQPNKLGADYVKKPFLSREGANVEVVRGGMVAAATPGDYAGRCVFQKFVPIADSGNGYPVIGSWIVGGEAAGMGIREDDSLVTGNHARFVPHVIED